MTDVLYLWQTHDELTDGTKIWDHGQNKKSLRFDSFLSGFS